MPVVQSTRLLLQAANSFETLNCLEWAGPEAASYLDLSGSGFDCFSDFSLERLDIGRTRSLMPEKLRDGVDG